MKNVETLDTLSSKENKVENSNDKSPIETSLSSLDKITDSLSSISTIILVGTSLNLLTSIVSLFKFAPLATAGYDEKFTILAIIAINIVLCLSVLSFLYVYEIKKKKGDVLFEEISDELEWYVNSDMVQKSGSKRPEIDARISLRSFFKTTQLPFFPGTYGPAFYLVINIALTILSAYFSTRLF